MKRQIFAGIRTIFKPLTAKDTPIHIQIEPVLGCNLKCKTCTPPEKITIIDMSLFKKIIDEIKPLNLTLSGGGEPLLTPKIFDMISYAKERGVRINLTTNATLLSDEIIKKIISSNLDLLSISLDAATSDVYNTMRNQDKFNLIIESIKKISKYKREMKAKYPEIRSSFVITRLNVHQMKEFVELNKELGIQTIYFQPLDLFGREGMKDILVGDMKEQNLRQALQDTLAYAKKLKINTNLGDILYNFSKYWRKYVLEDASKEKIRYCILPWFSTYIRINGDVKICCSMAEEGTIGNINNQSFASIWNSDKYQSARAKFKRGNLFFYPCKRCVPLGSLVDIWKSRLKFTFGFIKLFRK